MWRCHDGGCEYGSGCKKNGEGEKRIRFDDDHGGLGSSVWDGSGSNGSTCDITTWGLPELRVLKSPHRWVFIRVCCPNFIIKHGMRKGRKEDVYLASTLLGTGCKLECNHHSSPISTWPCSGHCSQRHRDNYKQSHDINIRAHHHYNPGTRPPAVPSPLARPPTLAGTGTMVLTFLPRAPPSFHRSITDAR